MSIEQDWIAIREKCVSIWGLTGTNTLVTFTGTLPAGTITLTGVASARVKLYITSLAKQIRTIAQQYPNTCTGSIEVKWGPNITYNGLAQVAPPDPPVIEPKLPPTTPITDGDKTFIAAQPK
jgi:hypothetical protein